MLSNDEYRAIFDASPDGCVVVTEDGSICGVNPKIEDLFGWTSDELLGRSIEVLIPESLRRAHEGHRARFGANPHDRPMGVGLSLTAVHRDGSILPVEVSLSPWRQAEGEFRVICTVRDITAYRRLQNFSEGALRASEEERQRIARELHDDTAQRLATLILQVRRLAEERGHEARRGLFEDVRAHIVEAADGVKRMSRGLRPPEIEEVGLALAVRAHVRSLHEAGGFTVQADLGVVDPYLDVTAKLALYRIIQEALSNARRHGKTDRAEVRLSREGDEIVAEVEDHGQGFVFDDVSDRHEGLGLIGMQERATMIKGRLLIEARPEEGTRVRVSVPLSNAETSDG